LATLCAGLLAACGGGDDPQPTAAVAASQQREAQAARRTIEPSQLPDLHRCLGRLTQALQADPTQRAVGLQCLAGTYRGLTPEGDACALQVDGGHGQFNFEYADQRISIAWDDVAFRPGQRALHNLEIASVSPAQPGVQLSRFSSAPTAVTETLVLRTGPPSQGGAGLPEMSYLRAEEGKTRQVRCRFGA
jgi:hypothetical protein